MHNQFRAYMLGVPIAKLNHLWKFVTGIDVQQRERYLPREKCFLRQPQHYRGILPDGIKHHRPRKLRRCLAQNVDTLRFERFQMVGSGRCGRRAL